MLRILLSLIVVIFTSFAAAAQDRPQVTAELEGAETVMGQPLVLRIKVLVPTWLPQPPDFPSLDLPGLLVRLPERASGPISERVGSDTWSGVQRAYRLYPLQPGRFEIPAQTLRITYAKPGGSDPVTEEIALDPITFDSVFPEAARGLNPLIIATGFSVEATVEGQDQLAVGGAVVRTLTAKISGTTPIMVPQITPDVLGEGLRSYPDEPKVTDAEDRGILSGTRTERTTYLATAEGDAELPAVRLDWFNLDTGKLETAEVPAVVLSIAQGEATEAKRQSLAWNQILVGLVVLLVTGTILSALWPRLTRLVGTLREQWRASEPYASRQVLSAIRRRDLGGAYSALEVWRGFFPVVAIEDLQSALVRVGGTTHAKPGKSAVGLGWDALRKSFVSARREARRDLRNSASHENLNPLNPNWRTGDSS